MWCSATPDYPHPADRKSGRCTFHQREYEQAMNAWRVRKHRYEAGNGPEPEPRDQYEANIDYSMPDEVWTGINGATRTRINNLLTSEAAAAARLAAFTNRAAIYDARPEDITQVVQAYLDVRGLVVDTLTELAADPAAPPGKPEPGNASGADT